MLVKRAPGHSELMKHPVLLQSWMTLMHCWSALVHVTLVTVTGTTVLGWGLLNKFPPFRYFPDFSLSSKCLLSMEYHVHIWQLSWAVATPVKYERDSNNLTGTFTKSNISLAERLMNKVLVTPTPGALSSSRGTSTHLKKKKKKTLTHLQIGHL